MLKQRISFLIFAAIMLVSVGQVRADSLTFSNTRALQDNGLSSIDLFSNQGVVLTGPQIQFLVDISGILPAAGSDTLRITFLEAGQAIQEITFRIPLFDVVPPPYSQLFSFTLQSNSSVPTSATLRIDILGTNPDFVIPGGPQAGQLVDSYTYSFQVAQPVPEPATVTLAGVAIAGIITRARRRKKTAASG